MTQEWVSGRFRGVYASERSGPSEGARRLPIELQYGELQEAGPSAGPPSGEDAEELRFAKLRRIRIAGAEGEPGAERTLFDVRIRAWQLLYPAESARRVYGTLVGELTGRLTPERVEVEPLPQATPMRAPAPAPPDVEPPAALAPLEREPVAPLPPPARLPTGEPDATTAEQDVERLLWLIVPVLLVLVGGMHALLCSPQAAALWLAPLAAVIAIRQTPSRHRIQDVVARRWFGGLCVLAQLFVMLAPLQTEWTAGCRPELRTQLALLATPLVLAAFVRTQTFVWACALIWTTALWGWCSSLEGSCSAAPPSGSALARAAPARTEPDGRWPAMPGAAGAGSLQDGHERSAASGSPPAAGRSAAAEPAPAGSAPARSTDPSAAARQPDRAPAVDALGFARISLDQATRDPETFFAPRGPRIYVPSDDLFDPRSGELRSGREANLEQLARLLALHPERRVAIEVHTDAVDDGAAQLALGRRRAAALAAWFARRGGTAPSFDVIGAAQPLVPVDGSSIEQRANRRLEVRLAE